MNALHRRPSDRPPRGRLRLLAFTAPALVAAAGAAGFLARSDPGAEAATRTHGRDAAVPMTFVHRRTGEPAGPATPARRWPAEIEHLLSAMPLIGDDGASPPTVETDQRCSRVDDGLAHCVMLECQTAGDQTACFELVVTARRLTEPPAAMHDGGGDDAPGAFEEEHDDDETLARQLMETRSAGARREHPGPVTGL